MKKLITVLLAGCIILSFTACGGSEDATSKTEISTLDVAAWSQVLIKDIYPSAEFPLEVFQVIGDSGQRRKIEGRVSVDGASPYQDFVMIVEFDETFETPTLISLDVNKTRVYENK